MKGAQNDPRTSIDQLWLFSFEWAATFVFWSYFSHLFSLDTISGCCDCYNAQQTYRSEKDFSDISLSLTQMDLLVDLYGFSQFNIQAE